MGLEGRRLPARAPPCEQEVSLRSPLALLNRLLLHGVLLHLRFSISFIYLSLDPFLFIISLLLFLFVVFFLASGWLSGVDLLSPMIRYMADKTQFYPSVQRLVLI